MFTSNSVSLNDMRNLEELKHRLCNAYPELLIQSLNVIQESYSFEITCLQFEDPIIIEYIGKSNDEIIKDFKEKVDICTLIGLRREVKVNEPTNYFNRSQVHSIKSGRFKPS